MKRAIALSILFLSLAASVRAEKLPVHVQCDVGSDQIGMRLCTSLSIAFLRNPAYREGSLFEERWNLRLTAADSSGMSAQAIVVTLGHGNGVETFVAPVRVYAARRDLSFIKADAMAASIMAGFDQTVREVKALVAAQ